MESNPRHILLKRAWPKVACLAIPSSPHAMFCMQTLCPQGLPIEFGMYLKVCLSIARKRPSAIPATNKLGTSL